jgi:transposase
MTYKNKHTPWRKEELMRELYWEEGMSQDEIAEELDTTQKTVCDWMDRHDIETVQREVGKLRDGEWLEKKYRDEGMSTIEIAERLDCSQRSVRVWLDKHGIEIRKSTREKPPYFRTRDDGYEEIKSKVNGRTKSFLVHRLAVVAWFGYDKVIDKHVHHLNHIPWDNREENVNIMEPSEHAKKHSMLRDRDNQGNYA